MDENSEYVNIISGKYKEIRELEIKLHKEFNNFNIIPRFASLKNKNKIGKTEWFSVICEENLLKSLNQYEATKDTTYGSK